MSPTARANLLEKAADLCLAITGRDPHKPGTVDVDYLRCVAALQAQHDESAAAAEVECAEHREQAAQLLSTVGELAVENATVLTLLAGLVDAIRDGGQPRLIDALRSAREYVNAQRDSDEGRADA